MQTCRFVTVLAFHIVTTLRRQQNDVTASALVNEEGNVRDDPGSNEVGSYCRPPIVLFADD